MSIIRMQFVILGLAITLGILVLIQSTNYVTAQGENGNVTGAKFLMIQDAQSGSVSEVNATTSTLQLNNVSDKTIIIDRGSTDRIVQSVNTTDFIGNWGTLIPVPGLRAPNAVLILDDVEQRDQDLALFYLFNPEYDPVANTLKYDITAENATTTSINLPSEFGQSTLVIGDDGLKEEQIVTPQDAYLLSDLRGIQ